MSVEFEMILKCQSILSMQNEKNIKKMLSAEIFIQHTK